MTGDEKALLVDSHAHLDMFKPADLDGLMGRAAQAGVGRIICVGVDLKSSRRAVEIAGRLPGVFAAVGIHPHDAGRADRRAFQELETLARRDRVIAVGETGLDYFRLRSPKEEQIDSFNRHIELAAKVDLPLIVHCRDAYEDVGTILAEKKPAKVLLHCFSADLAQAVVFLGMGCYISFAGVVTFSNAKALQEAAAHIPLDRLLVETDCPYLAPEPHRGRPNEPAFVAHTAQRIAELKSLPLQQVIKETAKTADNLFGPKFSGHILTGP